MKAPFLAAVLLSASCLAAFSADVDIVYRGTPHVVVVEPEPASLEVAPSLGQIDVSPSGASPRKLTVRNEGGTATSAAPVPTVASGPFRIASTTCSIALAPKSTCEVEIVATARSNGLLEGVLHVAGTDRTIALSGVGHGFVTCTSPGQACGDGSYFAGTVGGKHYYAIATENGSTLSGAAQECTRLGFPHLPDQHLVQALKPGIMAGMAAKDLDFYMHTTTFEHIFYVPTGRRDLVVQRVPQEFRQSSRATCLRSE